MIVTVAGGSGEPFQPDLFSESCPFKNWAAIIFQHKKKTKKNGVVDRNLIFRCLSFLIGDVLKLSTGSAKQVRQRPLLSVGWLVDQSKFSEELLFNSPLSENFFSSSPFNIPFTPFPFFQLSFPSFLLLKLSFFLPRPLILYFLPILLSSCFS